MKSAEIVLEYQDVLTKLNMAPGSLYKQSCSNDETTVTAWRDIWIKNIKENHKRFGSFKEHGVGSLYGLLQNKPCILAGSGPSLRLNAEKLKDRNGIPLISCLHNFHYFEDLGLAPEFYVTLDSGPVVIEEVYEGSGKSPEEYWAKSKDRTLIAFIGTDPKLFDLWQGKVYLYNVPIPDKTVFEETSKLEKFYTFLSTGGNVLGASLYFAKAILGSQISIFVGADFGFSPYGEAAKGQKFHPWDSKYDGNIGQYITTINCYGHPMKTWGSYYNFKCWFDHVSIETPGVYINCTEGGCLGAFREGNLVSIRQMDLVDCLGMFNIHWQTKDQCENPETENRLVLF